jgi:hypothetical protein
MVKKGGPWLLDLKSKLFEMSNADDCKLLQVQSEQSLLLILDIHRFLAKIPATYGSDAGVEVRREDAAATSCASLSMRAVTSNQVLVIVERETGSGRVALTLAAKALRLNILTVHELMAESDRQTLSSGSIHSHHMESLTRRTIGVICSHIAQVCGVENTCLVILCTHDVVHARILCPLVEILLHGHVGNYLLAQSRTKILQELQNDIKSKLPKARMGSSTADLPLQARVLLCRSEAKKTTQKSVQHLSGFTVL